MKNTYDLPFTIQGTTFSESYEFRILSISLRESSYSIKILEGNKELRVWATNNTKITYDLPFSTQDTTLSEGYEFQNLSISFRKSSYNVIILGGNKEQRVCAKKTIKTPMILPFTTQGTII